MQQQLLTEHEFDPALPGWRVRVLLTITGVASAAARVPLGVALVLDRSGSMAGSKIDAARDAAAGLIRRLHPSDRIGVVLFDDVVETLSDPVTGADQGGLLNDLARVDVRGSTNLSGGWLRGRDQMASLPNLGSIRRVLLLTDGQANCGITDHARLAALSGLARAQGISTSAIGFGDDYDEELLKAMADAGGGNLWHIERTDQAQQVFQEELAGLQSLSAQNLAVELRPSADVASFVVVHDYPASVLPDGRRIELGDLYAREPRKLLVEFVVPARTPDVRSDLAVAHVQLSAHVLLVDGGIELRVMMFPVALTLEGQGSTHPEVRREVVLLAAAKARDEAVERARAGDVESASHLLRDQARTMRASGLEDAVVLAQASDLEQTACELESLGVREQDMKYMKQRAYNQYRGKASYDAMLARPMPPDDALAVPPIPPRRPRKPKST